MVAWKAWMRRAVSGWASSGVPQSAGFARTMPTHSACASRWVTRGSKGRGVSSANVTTAKKRLPAWQQGGQAGGQGGHYDEN